MSPNIYKGLLLGLILVIATAGFFLIQGRDIKPGTDLEGTYSVNDIVALNKNLECTFDKSDESTKVSGKIIVSENRVKGEFDIDSKGQNFKSYFIMRDGLNYTWTSLLKAGFRYPVAEGSSTINNYVLNPNEKGEYKCSYWTEKKGEFDLPQDIKFSSI